MLRDRVEEETDGRESPAAAAVVVVVVPMVMHGSRPGERTSHPPATMNME